MLKTRLFLRSVFRRSQVDRELDEELQDHLAREIQEGLNRGLPLREAEHAARRAMGAITQNKERCRDTRRVNFIDDLTRDLRYAARAMRRSPGFAVLAVLIMGLGIGANTAVFSVVNAVLLRPLPYRDPSRIVTLTTRLTNGVLASGSSIIDQISIPNFRDWQAQSSSFEAMAYYGGREAPVMAGATAEYARVGQVGPGFFRVFAAEPLAGRLFTDEEMKPGSSGAAIISYSYSQSHFGENAHALGQVVRVYGRPYPTAGVLPPGFGFPDKTDIWIPARVSPEAEKYRTSNNWLALGRLKAGVSLEQAQAEMQSIAGRLAQQYPESDSGRTVAVTRIADKMVSDVRLTLYLLLGAVGVVLLIACANTATLLLGRAVARAREVAVRAALGASRRRIVRQLMTESLLLSLLAGIAGLALAYGGSKVLIALAPADVPRLAETGIDRAVLNFTFGISILTSFLFGVVPAFYASKMDLNEAMKQSARSLMRGGMVRMRAGLVIAEIVFAVVLLCGSGLLIKSFAALQNVTLGFRPENVLVMRATVPGPLQAEAATTFFQDLLPRVAHLPGVLSAGASMAPPGYDDSNGSRGAYAIDHLPAQLDVRDQALSEVVNSIVAPGTFAALGIPLRTGRDFSDSDTADRALVAVVNETLIRKSFRGQNPIGRTIYCIFDNFKPMTIVGVVGDVRQLGASHESMPECYMPYAQHGFNGNTLSIMARTAGDPNALQETMRRLAHKTSPDVPVRFTTMEARLAENAATPRFRTLLFATFAVLAAGLAMAGVYGVMAYAVTQRANEIGLRMALGASSGSVARLVLSQGLKLAGIGLVIGVGAAFAGTRLLKSILFEIKPYDPLVYFSVAALLGAVALAASYIPARRASKIDPLAALRSE